MVMNQSRSTMIDPPKHSCISVVGKDLMKRGCSVSTIRMNYSFHPITEAELKATILKSKPTSCSLDPLSTSLLLEFIDDLLPTLMNIINFSLSSGTFPLTFRSAEVKPLLKKALLDPDNLKKLLLSQII